ncbi:MAG: phosphatidylinositol-specific phospholipase C/glycerophosphodiester phosphodiesterase family protein [Planctomycetes bacterium]|nr:phosphatidylinositol-specific phospholipase C/glycerophosphodiester phosphodiesterase family protein [Planctomycetota bacterium]
MVVRWLLVLVMAFACGATALGGDDVYADTGRDALVSRVNFAEPERPSAPGDAPRFHAAEPANARPVPPHAGHAHNDYWHDRPLLDALERGFCSVEADVFLRDGDLLVGHAVGELRPDRTLAAVYLDPIRERLEASGCVAHEGRPFSLLVDIKADGAGAYRVLAEQLRPLRRFLVGDESRAATLRVIVSGDRPIDAMAADAERLAGVDGRLEDLDRDDRPATLMPLVSDRWGTRFTWYGAGPMPDAERAELRRIVNRAHARGQAVRFWATPDNASFWEELSAAGVDLISCDDLDAFVGFAASAGERP